MVDRHVSFNVPITQLFWKWLVSALGLGHWWSGLSRYLSAIFFLVVAQGDQAEKLRTFRERHNWQSFFIVRLLSRTRERKRKKANVRCFRMKLPETHKTATTVRGPLKSSDFHSGHHPRRTTSGGKNLVVPELMSRRLRDERLRRRRKVFAECNWISSTQGVGISNYL